MANAQKSWSRDAEGGGLALHCSTSLLSQILPGMQDCCHWGALSEITTDNAAPFIAALDELAKKYHIYRI
jgi:hypothetical protein